MVTADNQDLVFPENTILFRLISKIIYEMDRDKHDIGS